MNNKKYKEEEILENKLKERGIIPTAIRLSVLKYFLSQNSAISLIDLEQDFEYSDRTTLFRTLKTFEKMGLLHSINEGHTTSYALCHENCDQYKHLDSHMHFYCRQCNKIFCLPQITVPSVHIPDNFTVEKVDIVVHGLCENCS